MAWRHSLLHLIKQDCLLKTSLRILTITFLTVFPSVTNLKLHKISVTPKVIKKVITNLDSSKASGPDCFPLVVLKHCVPERTSGTPQYVSERILFSRLLESLIDGHCM